MRKHAIATLNAAQIDEEADRVEEKTPPLTPVICEVVRRNGEREMARPPWSLGGSGVAGGPSIGLSLLAQPTRHRFSRAARLWAIVLRGNLAGKGLAARAAALTPVIDPSLLAQMHAIGRHAMAHEPAAASARPKSRIQEPLR
jgi:formate-nitrite transporter family protein